MVHPFSCHRMMSVVIPGLLFFCYSGIAQPRDSARVKWSAYIEPYYVYDFNRPEDNNRPPFVYSFNRHNEVNVNIGFLKAALETNSVRANVALMAGTYANANLAAEPGVLKNIFEANAGIRLSKQRSIWLDAGVFPSHIGFESAIGKDCWNLTRSILADNSPYFETGIKASYTRDHWFFSLLLLNGWQRIHRLPGNTLPSLGTQITFTPGEKVLVNSSTFVGTDTPDSARLMRYFHNLYAILQLSPRVGLTVGFDIGMQEAADGPYDVWFSPVIIGRFQVSEKLAVALRAEYYQDPAGVIIATDVPGRFRTAGFSTNLDYRFSSHFLWRVEWRSFAAKDPIFLRDRPVSSNTSLATSLCVGF